MKAIMAPLGCVLGFMALAGLEYLRWSMTFLPNEVPVEGPYFWSRSLLAALLSFAIVVGIDRLGGAGARRALSLGQRQVVSVSLAALIVFVTAFLLSPIAFYRVSLEDGPVEWISALLPLAGSVLLLWCCVATWFEARVGKGAPWMAVVLLFCAALLFVLGMEEISWMQRIFHFATPKSLDSNIQHEFNFHNLATNQVGVLHKLVGFAFPIYLPFIFETAPLRFRSYPLAALVPSRAVALASAPLAGLNYNGWEFLPLQMTTYMTISVLAIFALRAWREGTLSEAALASAMAAVIVVAQIVFLAHGDKFVRLWDVTEYKELYIAFGLFLWAFETVSRMRTHRAAAVDYHHPVKV